MFRILLFACLCLCALMPAAEPAAGPEATSKNPTAKVGYLPIHGMIDQGKSAFFKRSLASAKDQGVTTLVVHLTTDGGLLDAGREMLQAALQTPKDAPRLVAFIDNRAYSAGSLIAYGHDEILLTPNATLGDIGVITQGADGKIEYLPEKIETIVRTLLRSAAQNKGWNEAKLVKMTARNQDLYRIDLKEGAQFVIEDEWPAYKAAHPGVTDEQRILVLGEDRLMSYTAREAVAEHMATALVDDLTAVYARLGVAKSAVVDLSPSSTEELSWLLASFAPLLAAAAVFFVFMELKAPGFGLWGTLAIIAGTAFFVCQFYLDLANSLEVVLVVLGIALVIVELFVFSLHGLFAATGAGLLVIGLVLAFMPNSTQFQPDTPFYADSLIHAVRQSIYALAALSVGVVLLILALPKMALRIRLADGAAIDASSAGTIESTAATLTGRPGRTLTALRPGGQVDVEDREYSAVSEHGEFLEPGTPVTVCGSRFGELVVRPVLGPLET